MHHLELLLQTGLIHFISLQLLLKRSDIVERHEPVSINVLLAGLPHMEVTLLPKALLRLGML
jgi:hypothetical protein